MSKLRFAGTVQDRTFMYKRELRFTEGCAKLIKYIKFQIFITIHFAFLIIILIDNQI